MHIAVPGADPDQGGGTSLDQPLSSIMTVHRETYTATEIRKGEMRTVFSLLIINLDTLIGENGFVFHSLDPNLHIALKQVGEEFLCVSSKKMDSLDGGQWAHNPANCDVVVLTFDDNLRDPNLVPGALYKLAYEVVFYSSVHRVTARVV